MEDPIRLALITLCIQAGTKLIGVNKDVFLIVEAKDVYIRNVKNIFKVIHSEIEAVPVFKAASVFVSPIKYFM